MTERVVTIPWADLEKISFALSVAHKVLNEKGTRLDTMDQNPMGLRDIVANANRLAYVALTKSSG